MAVKNRAASALARLRNQAKEEGIPFQMMLKTHFMGHIDNVRIPFSVDIGLDDIIVPGPVKRKVVTRLPDFEPPYVYTYSLESTIAEKFDAILQRMAGTSRMKDFYDIYYLSGVFDFSGQVLRKAVSSTLSHRKRELSNYAFEEIDDFKDNPFLNVQWNAFEPARNANLAFADTVDRLRTFLEPVYESILEGTEYDCNWSGREKAWSAERE